MIAALLAAAAASAVSAAQKPAEAEDALPALGALGPQPAGATALTALAGRPMYGLRLEHGFGGAADLGLGLDVSWRGYYRPTVRGRLRALRMGRGQVVFRGVLGAVLGSAQGVAQTADGELALQIGYAPHPRLGAFADLALLGATDFTRARTAAFAQLQAGLAYAPPGPISLLASAGALSGVRGTRAVASGGAAFRF